MVSPFEAGENSANAASEAAAALGELEFTPSSVDEVLNRVRPYLVADGGDVAVVEVRSDEGRRLAAGGRLRELPVVHHDDEDGHRARAARTVAGPRQRE